MMDQTPTAEPESFARDQERVNDVADMSLDRLQGWLQEQTVGSVLAYLKLSRQVQAEHARRTGRARSTDSQIRGLLAEISQGDQGQTDSEPAPPDYPQVPKRMLDVENTAAPRSEYRPGVGSIHVSQATEEAANTHQARRAAVRGEMEDCTTLKNPPVGGIVDLDPEAVGQKLRQAAQDRALRASRLPGGFLPPYDR